MQQALQYADILDIPFVFSSNGDGFLFHDRTGISGKTETELPLSGFPSPEKLWKRYCEHKNIKDSGLPVVTQDYHTDISGKTPRYYQRIAINRTLEAIAGGQDRILLVMATLTGKTYTAFQIIWRLWKARTKKRILFLADRNIFAIASSWWSPAFCFFEFFEEACYCTPTCSRTTPHRRQSR
jgi:type I restriction enzyme R subunit